MKKEYRIGNTFREEAALEECAWSPNPAPAAFFSAAFDGENGLRFRLRSLAAPERTVNREPDSAVWEDSCLECFFSFDGVNYVNLEANAAGALRASVGPDRHDRRLLRELGTPLPRVEAEVASDRWALTLVIPAALFESLLGASLQPGLSLGANFYSCGDKTPAPHYAAWSPVETETPDFHRPEFFGELRLE